MPWPEARVAAVLAAVRGPTEDLLARLVACPSIRGEQTTIDRLLDTELLRLGATVRHVRPDLAGLETDPEWSPPPIVPSEPPVNLLAQWGSQPGGTVLFAHVDTEPVHEPDAWTSDPFVLAERGGRLHGLGAADDKAGVASILGASQALADLGATAGLALMLVHGKQGGALGSLPAWRAIGEARRAIYAHPAETGHGLAEQKVASRGIIGLEVTVEGRTPPPHEERTPVSADPRAGVNAIDAARRLLSALEGWTSPDLGRVVSVGAIRAAGAPFEVPDRCTIRLDVWFEEGTVGDVLSETQSRLEAIADADDWLRVHPPRIRVVGSRANPAACPPDDLLPERVAVAIERVTGRRPVRYPAHAASDIRFPLRCARVPAVGFGATGGGFYGPDEWVERRSLHQATEALVRSVLALA